MKKLGMVLCLLTMLTSAAWAVNMVEQKVFYDSEIVAVGTPDFPPFSWYERESEKSSNYLLKGAFVEPTIEAMKKYKFKFTAQPYDNADDIDLSELLLGVRGGKYQLMFGVYTGTKIFNGLGILFPSVVSNPIHIITLPATQEKIRTGEDLKNLRGIAYKKEFISDYGKQKIANLNITYIDSLYELYEQLFTGEADYIIGSEYYHKMVSPRFGIERYLAYSKEPLFKMPVFIAMSKLMPKYSVYEKAFADEFNKPEYSLAVKKEILRIIYEETQKNIGVVPPAFAKNAVQSENAEDSDKPTEETENQESSTAEAPSTPESYNGGKIILKSTKQKSDDEILDGI